MGFRTILGPNNGSAYLVGGIRLGRPRSGPEKVPNPMNAASKWDLGPKSHKGPTCFWKAIHVEFEEYISKNCLFNEPHNQKRNGDFLLWQSISLIKYALQIGLARLGMHNTNSNISKLIVLYISPFLEWKFLFGLALWSILKLSPTQIIGWCKHSPLSVLISSAQVLQ